MTVTKTSGFIAALPALLLSGMAQAEPAPGTIPVEPVRSEAEAPKPISPDGPQGFYGIAALFAGYDNNANTALEFNRTPFLGLRREQRESASAFAGVAGSAAYLALFGEGDRFAWRTSIDGETRTNPSAHFADNGSLKAKSQLRWTQGTVRLSGGPLYNVSYFDDEEYATAPGFFLKGEKRLGDAMLSLEAERAAWRFEDFSIQDVDSTLLRGSVEWQPGDSSPARWSPEFTLLAGTEDAREAGSPYGRDMWGASGAIRYLVVENLEATLDLELQRSDYDGRPSGPGERVDKWFAAGITLDWQPQLLSPWTSSCGIHAERNQSAEPIYDTDRFYVLVSVSYAWRPDAP